MNADNSLKQYDSENPPEDLRRRLDELCKGKNYPFDDPLRYKTVFFPEFDGKLIVEVTPPPRRNQYNCFAYALGLDIWVRTTVMAQTVANGDLSQTENPQAGDIVIYLDTPTNIRHAGRYFSKTEVISKWATGPLFRHETFMCPFQYGNRVMYYKAVSKEFAESLISKYPIPNE